MSKNHPPSPLPFILQNFLLNMKTRISNLILLSSIALAYSAQAQTTTSFAYTNVSLHIGNGSTIEKGAIGVKDGKIVEVGASINTADYTKVIDGNGAHIYPGLIAPNTRVGLEEVESVRATLDYNEVGHFNPNIRSIIAYNTDSDIIPTLRSNGILMVQAVPSGGRISGQSSVLHLDAYNWEEATVKADGAIHLMFPGRFYQTGWWAEPGSARGNKTYDQEVEAIKAYFDAAKAYYQKKEVETKNLKFEAMNGLFRKEKKLFVHANEARAIQEAILTLEPYNVDIVIVGGEESWMIMDFLKEKNIPIILGALHSLPTTADSDYDQPYKTPKMLADKGIKFALSMDGSWQHRNLPFQAGQAVTFGLSKEEALRSITLSTAEILGIADKVGSLEKGKEATFIVSKGDVLDMRSSVVTDAYIRGKQVALDKDKQKRLYKEYMDKYFGKK